MSNIADAIARKKKQNPQFEYMWKASLPDLNLQGFIDPTGAGKNNILDVTKSFIFGTQSEADDLNHRVYSVEFPYENFEVNKHSFGSSFFFTPGTHEVGSCSIRVDEYEDGKTLKYFEDWRRLIRNDDGTYNPPVVYKRNFGLIRLSASGEELHVSVYKDCFPSEISPTSFSYDSGGVVQYSVTLVGDSVSHSIIAGAELRKIVQFGSQNFAQRAAAGILNKIKSLF